MKTKVEVLGYEIEIEEVDGVVTVKAELDGETVEEFTLETPEEGGEHEGADDEGGEDVQSFKDFDSQDEEDDNDFEDSEDFESEDDDEEDKGENTLESFQAFFEKRN